MPICHVRRMKRRASLTAVFAAGAWLALPAGFCRAAGESPRIKVLIVDGFSNHDWRRTTHLVKAILEPTGLFEVSVSTAPARMDDPAYATWLPDFKGHEVVVQTCNDLTGTGCPWPEPAREAFDRYVREGGGVFMMHAANNAFASWEAYNRIIGLGWRKRDFGQALRVRDDGSIERIPAGEGPGTVISRGLTARRVFRGSMASGIAMVSSAGRRACHAEIGMHARNRKRV